MSTDGQGRPLSDDGQWAWNGTEWVPAAIGGATIAQQTDVEPVSETDLEPASDTDGEPDGEPEHEAPHDNTATAAEAPNVAEGPVTAATSPFGIPKPAISSLTRAFFLKPRVIAAAVIVIVVAAVSTLIATFDGPKKTQPYGAFACTKSGSTQVGTVTFKSGEKYSLDHGGTSGSYTRNADNLTFGSGTLANSTGTYDPVAKSVTILLDGSRLTCKPK